MPSLATVERVVKCPTGHCPGWITVDDERPQTVPCRYCRVTVNTLQFLLNHTPDFATAAAEAPRLAPGVHQAFNSLLLDVAGITGGNVYLRPIDRTIVNLLPGTRGVIVEYNPVIARRAGPEALVALILHPLLHVAIHPPQDRPIGLVLRPGARDREHLQHAANYLPLLADHAWIGPRIAGIDPGLRAAEQAWGLGLAGLLTGNEAFFLPYMAERNRRWLMDQFDAADAADGAAVAAAALSRLAALSARFFGGQREDLRRLFTIVQLAEIGLRDPERLAAYQAALDAAGLPGVGPAAPIAARLTADLAAIQATSPAYDAGVARQAVETALKALNLHTAFEVQTLKRDA